MQVLFVGECLRIGRIETKLAEGNGSESSREQAFASVVARNQLLNHDAYDQKQADDGCCPKENVDDVQPGRVWLGEDTRQIPKHGKASFGSLGETQDAIP